MPAVNETPDSPEVSIITVVLNDVAGIKNTLESVRLQDYGKIEHIVIDGGSTDGTVDIIRQYQRESLIWLSEPDSGIYNAMNKGLSKAGGRLIGTLNSGDSYSSDTVTRLIDVYRDSPETDVFHGNISLISGCESLEEIFYPDLDYSRLPFKMTLNHPGSFITRKAYEDYGKYNEYYKIAGDYELFSRFYLKGARFKYIDHIMAYMAAGGISETKAMASAFECNIARISHGISGSRSGSILAKDILLITLRDIFRFLRLYCLIRAWRRSDNQAKKEKIKAIELERRPW